jgi:lipoic acid synthetase
MILGDRCTRDCRFCAVSHGAPEAPDPDEPRRLAEAVKRLGLEYVVITSVTRDDLPDQGAEQFARTIRSVRCELPGVGVEVLVPDFGGRLELVDVVLHAGPDVFSHNVETVRRLYETVRPQADLNRSLKVLKHAADARYDGLVKSSLMLGLGETRLEVDAALRDLRCAGTDIAYVGQYLRPSRNHLKVQRFIPPEEFDDIRETALGMGFGWVSAGPFVRSSYEAERAVQALVGNVCS